MSQAIEAPSAPRLRSIAGRPTLTTEPSMKARLEPRIVAASVPDGCAVTGDPGGAAATAAAMPRSQGPAAAVATTSLAGAGRQAAHRPIGGVDALRDDLFLPLVRVGIEGVADFLLDGAPRRFVGVGVVLEPLVGAQGLHHFGLWQRSVLEGDSGVLGLRALFVGGEPHHSGEQ